MVISSENEEVEPLYGRTYLPRKFKTAIAVPPSNDVDVLAHDLGFIAVAEDDEHVQGGKRLVGFNVTVGGGMGMTHGNKKTYPRLGDVLGFCTLEQALTVGEHVVRIQKERGDRVNRKHARLKYTIDDFPGGADGFREELEKRCGFKLGKARKFVFTENGDRYGWIREGGEKKSSKGGKEDGTWHFGMFIQNGRVKDVEKYKLRSALRAIAKFAESVHPSFLSSPSSSTTSLDGAPTAMTPTASHLTTGIHFRLTANQNLIISNIPTSLRPHIESILADHGIIDASVSHTTNGTNATTVNKKNAQALTFSTLPLSGMRLNSMACVALPTCALAMAESERYLPDLIGRIEEEILEPLGLRDEEITVRMTGCPNGCARPQIAEIGFIGKAPGAYNMYLGGGFTGQRLSKLYRESIGEDEIVEELKGLFGRYKRERVEGEKFGDFVIRVGVVKETRHGRDFHA
ncbi:hypothetical protein HK102_003737 [Quaeritorhiza haematococci]|nr:hypothetical protein HK102_003737 [Quaeritorhiza haematococci]